MQATMQLFVHFASSRKFHITPVSLTALVKIGMGLIKGLNRGAEHVLLLSYFFIKSNI